MWSPSDSHSDREPLPAVVLLSGGMDSSCLIHYVAKRLLRRPVYALSFFYRQRHRRELECAQYQANLVGASHQIVDIAFLGDLVKSGTSLVEQGTPVPDLTEVQVEDRDQPPTYVPNRNMILLSLAAAFAEAHGATEVYYGAQANDEYGYWDCTPAFLDAINRVLALNRRTPVRVCAPFVRMSKAESLRIGLELGVDYSHTWSCYRGGEVPCGTCPTCVERHNAFAAAGVPDPLG
ncbi:MAG TPA: 7-cyano-7-deazaguanine synthase QueC [Candidatus Hydrogenedentes bacterium]|nr:7-cyano-7-deazaguanine synthase QueC [Candidatus Hydrogenedentota bacterium]HOL78289.1 7-cyano-7-deazaguanine synthase QueC [Candidatus Hydrogenedentota bacterium]HPO87450.1 7-cyano-7-deazaguanine synthase QueC [Candidatus Hydrogenedentota bacterium]